MVSLGNQLAQSAVFGGGSSAIFSPLASAPTVSAAAALGVPALFSLGPSVLATFRSKAPKFVRPDATDTTNLLRGLRPSGFNPTNRFGITADQHAATLGRIQARTAADDAVRKAFQTDDADDLEAAMKALEAVPAATAPTRTLLRTPIAPDPVQVPTPASSPTLAAPPPTSSADSLPVDLFGGLELGSDLFGGAAALGAGGGAAAADQVAVDRSPNVNPLILAGGLALLVGLVFLARKAA